MILFVNACVREQSRTEELARAVLARLEGEVEEVRLYPDGPTGLDRQSLALRDTLLSQGEHHHPMLRYAHQFAAADTVVLAAPFWDLAFPTRVRAYLEEVTASGITFRYTPEGRPQGLCKAKRLIYVTTAGGPILRHFGYEYVQAMAQTFYGIEEVRLVKAEGLDVWGNDPQAILAQARAEIPAMLGE